MFIYRLTVEKTSVRGEINQKSIKNGFPLHLTVDLMGVVKKSGSIAETLLKK